MPNYQRERVSAVRNCLRRYLAGPHPRPISLKGKGRGGSNREQAALAHIFAPSGFTEKTGFTGNEQCVMGDNSKTNIVIDGNRRFVRLVRP